MADAPELIAGPPASSPGERRRSAVGKLAGFPTNDGAFARTSYTSLERRSGAGGSTRGPEKNSIGLGVKPMKTKANVSQPSTIRNGPSGTVSSAVGGCRGPKTKSSTTIRMYDSFCERIM